MDDLRMVRELSGNAPLLKTDDLAPARGRLLAGMGAEQHGGEPAARPVRRTRRVRRLLLAGWATAGVAAAVAGVLVLVPDRIGGQVPAARAEAAQVLHGAAAAALQLPDVEPRPDQFIYTKTRSGNSTDESWLSVDGTHDGLLRQTPATDIENMPLPGCRDGRAAVTRGGRMDPRQTEPCTPSPAYLPDLPTDPDAMLDHLNANYRGEPGDSNALGKDVHDLLASKYLRPQVRAALFEAAARIPGLTVVPGVEDGAGRPGIGIAWSHEGRSGALVFDETSHTFLGTVGTSAVLEVAVVDEVGQRP
ncbi:CU044_5270 family protein [Micromonospora musae]|uniref:CU044_5270 family protein n=1 Tax=Micromonospora musae TaxID=1894970 RepID=UPI00341429B8